MLNVTVAFHTVALGLPSPPSASQPRAQRNEPSSAATLWKPLPTLVKVTVSPTWMVSVDGVNVPVTLTSKCAADTGVARQSRNAEQDSAAYGAKRRRKTTRRAMARTAHARAAAKPEYIETNMMHLLWW